MLEQEEESSIEIEGDKQLHQSSGGHVIGHDLLEAPCASKGPGKLSNQLPITRVKNIIKSDPDITLASQEATLVISKATELFLRHLSRQSYVYTVRGKRKTIQRRDVFASLPQRDEFAFLEGAID